jgi:sugar/nucleoside kinase (ribokinase family)
MSRILVVGSVAFDSIETPFGRVEHILGGAANYFAIGASFFCPVQMVAVVGEDFPQSHLDLLKARGVDTSGIVRAAGKTFHWRGKYGFDLNSPQTLETCLNVFEHFKPEIPKAFRSTPYVFLANIDPELQLRVLDEVEGKPLVAMDSMNFWLETKKQAVKKVLERVDILTINDGEARMLGETPWLVTAARRIRAMGPKVVVIKKGEHGVLLFLQDGSVFSAPALPLEEVKDPTGAGDTFASGFFGSLAKANAKITDVDELRKAVVYGSVVASFTVEDFGFNRLLKLQFNEIERRFEVFKQLTQF